MSFLSELIYPQITQIPQKRSRRLTLGGFDFSYCPGSNPRNLRNLRIPHDASAVRRPYLASTSV